MPRIIRIFRCMLLIFLSICMEQAMSLVVTANFADNSISVIANNKTTTLDVEQGPREVICDNSTNLCYITNSISNSISVLDLKLMKVVASIKTNGEPRGIAVNSREHQLYTITKDTNYLIAYNTERYSLLYSIELPKGPRNIVFDQSLSRVYISCNESSKLAIVDIIRGKLEQVIDVPNQPYGLAISDRYRMLLITSIGENTLFALNTKSMSMLFNVPIGKHPTSIAINGDKVFVTNLDENKLTVFDLKSRVVIDSIKTGKCPFGLFLSTRDELYVTNNSDDTVSIIEPGRTFIKSIGKSPHGIHGII